MIWFFSDLWRGIRHGHGVDRWLAILLFVCILALVACVVALPFIFMQDRRERENLHEQGCEVIEQRTEFSHFMYVGKTLVPQYRTIETWSCPDGRKFER